LAALDDQQFLDLVGATGQIQSPIPANWTDWPFCSQTPFLAGRNAQKLRHHSDIWIVLNYVILYNQSNFYPKNGVYAPINRSKVTGWTDKAVR
jgi:hypothetical protein